MSAEPMSGERFAEIRNRRYDEVTPGPWLVADGEGGKPVVYVEKPMGDGISARVLLSAGGASEADVQFVASARRSVPELVTEVERLQAQVAELLAERRITNEALDDAVQELRERHGDGTRSYPPAMPWAALLDHEDLTDFLDELAAAAIRHASSEVALAEVEKACSTWRLIAEAQHGHNTAPGPKPTEGEHYAIVHHAYTTPRDLPELGGAL